MAFETATVKRQASAHIGSPLPAAYTGSEQALIIDHHPMGHPNVNGCDCVDRSAQSLRSPLSWVSITIIESPEMTSKMSVGTTAY